LIVLTINEKKITVKNKQEIIEFNRNDIISFSPAGDREIDLWSMKFTSGINLKSGNTEQTDINIKLSAKRRTADSRFLLDYIGNLSKTDAVSGDLVETINNHRLSGALDIYVTRYFFYNPINVEFYSDPFQNIELRTTVGAGLGYTFVDTGTTEWNLSAGPAFISTKYNSVQAGNDIRVDSGSLKISTELDTELTKTIDFIYKYNILISEKKSGGYSHHMIATLKSEISKDLDLDISAVWDRITYPTADDTGFEPEQDDFQLLLGMSYSF
jgi:putative salt-induced outer membrane protein YdiY